MAKLRDKVFGRLYKHNRNNGVIATIIVGIAGIIIALITQKEKLNVSLFAGYEPVHIFQTLLCAVLLVGIGYFVLQDRARYAETQSHVHYAAHILRDFVASKEYSAIKTQAALEEVLRSATHIFSVLTSTNCWSSLKIYDSDKNEVTCQYVCYLPDNAFQNDLAQHEAKPITLFSSIDTLLKVLQEPKNSMEEKDRFYLCQNMHAGAESGSYRHPKLDSSHRSGYNKIRKRYKNWPLSASSCLVIPIRWIDESEEDKPVVNFKGFFCVDSASTNVFSKRYDVHLAAVYADIIYVILNSLTESLPQNNKTNQKQT